jgi:glucose-1-phosphate thymidylyltransferase
MKNKGIAFVPGQVEEWLDCGNKNATVHTNSRYLEFRPQSELISAAAVTENSVLIHPVYLADGVIVRNSVLGPHVSVGPGSIIENSVIESSIIQEKAELKNALIKNSMVGNHAAVKGRASDLSLGDYNVIHTA